MANIANMPEIRFEGYTDPWEQRKLGEFVAFGGGHTPSMADSSNYDGGEILWVTSQDVKADYLSDTTTKITEKGASELNLYPAGTLLMVTRSGILRHTLPVSMLRKPSTVNQDIRTLSTDSSCSPLWLMQYLKAHSKQLLLEYGKTGTTVESIDFAKMKSMQVSIPLADEQEAIGDFFYRLDNLITLHQRKLEKLKAFKESMLQGMFPKPGCDVPAIRFEGYTDPWDQRKLGELLSFQNGFNGSSESFGSGTPLISVMNILADGFIKYDEIRGKARLNAEEQRRFSVDYGDVLFQRSSENYEDAGTSNVYLDRDASAAFGGFVIRGKKIADYDPVFIKYLLDSAPVRDQITRRAQGAQHVNVSQDTLADVSVFMPDMKEQEAIGAVMFDIDTLSTLHQRKLALLRRLKSALLQKMFA